MKQASQQSKTAGASCAVVAIPFHSTPIATSSQQVDAKKTALSSSSDSLLPQPLPHSSAATAIAIPDAAADIDLIFQNHRPTHSKRHVLPSSIYKYENSRVILELEAQRKRQITKKKPILVPKPKTSLEKLLNAILQIFLVVYHFCVPRNYFSRKSAYNNKKKKSYLKKKREEDEEEEDGGGSSSDEEHHHSRGNNSKRRCCGCLQGISIEEIGLNPMQNLDVEVEITPYQHMKPEKQHELKQFVMDLGYVLLACGSPSFRVEHHLKLIMNYYNLHATVLATPNSLYVSFGAKSPLDPCFVDNETMMIRIEDGSVDIYKLCKADDIADDLVNGKIRDIAEATDRLQKLIDGPDLSPMLNFISDCMTPTFMTMLLDGSWVEIVGSLFAGMVLGGIGILANRFDSVKKFSNVLIGLFAMLSTIFFKICTLALGNFFPAVANERVSVVVISLCALMNLEPGEYFTTALEEISHMQLLSGVARMFDGVSIVMQGGLGYSLGYYLSTVVEKSFPEWRWMKYHELDPFPTYVHVICMLMLTISYMMLLRVPLYPLLLITICTASVLGYWVSDLLIQSVGEEVGCFVGGLIISVIGNLFTKFTNHPADVPISVSILLLVPNCFDSFVSFTSNDEISALEFMYSIAMFSLAICMGLLTGHGIIDGKKKIWITDL